MKKIGLLLLSPVLLIASIIYLKTSPATLSGAADTPLKLPAGANIENTARRKAWELTRYADPETGKIPKGIRFLERAFSKRLPMAVNDRSGSDWIARGPWNYGGRSRAIAIDITNENRLVAGGVSGGVWLSENGGQSWQRRTALNAHPGCVSIAQDTRPGKTNTWYYLSGEAYGASQSANGAYYLGDGLFKSNDGGVTWAAVGSTAGGNPQSFTTEYQLGWRVITSPKDSADVVFMAINGAIMRSANGGATWSVVRGTTTSTAAYFTDIAVSSNGVFYATLSSDGASKGIWRSTNGTQWVSVTPAGFPATYDRIVIGINPDNENEVYFMAVTPGAGFYSQFIGGDNWTSLWKYTYLGGDGAGSNGQWENRSQNLPGTGTEFDRFVCQGGYDMVLRVQPGTGHVFAGGTSLWRSTDGFATAGNTTHIAGYKPGTSLPFFELYPNHHPDLHEALFLPSDPNVMLTASDGGLHRTEDCLAPTVAWSSLNWGYQTTQFYTTMIEHTLPGDNTILGGLQDNGNLFVSGADPQKSWKQTINGDGGYGAIADGKSFYVVSAQSGGAKVVKCNIDDDGNVTAFRRIDPIGPNPDRYQFINPLAIDPVDNNLLYLAAGKQIYRQNELGNIALTGAWDSIAQGWIAVADTTLDPISTIAVSRSNPAHRVYVGTERRRIYRIDNADGPAPALTLVKEPAVSIAANVSCIAVDPDNADRVVVTYSNYSMYSIWLSEDGGQSWKKAAGNLEATLSGSGNGPSVRWLSILPLPDGTRKYFCATSTGLFSTDSLLEHTNMAPGTQWTLEGPDVIGASVVDFIDVRPVDGLVMVATHGTGMYSANFMPSSGNEEPVASTPRVSVSPNPAGQFVQFAVEAAPEEDILVRLYDLTGKLIRQTSCNGTARVDLEGAARGVYVYELRGKGWRKSGRFVKG